MVVERQRMRDGLLLLAICNPLTKDIEVTERLFSTIVLDAYILARVRARLCCQKVYKTRADGGIGQKRAEVKVRCMNINDTWKSQYVALEAIHKLISLAALHSPPSTSLPLMQRVQYIPV
jgi:hypothetical protein